jgi:xanthine dehydrogenase accessory factor
MRDWLRSLRDALRAGETPVVRVVIAAVRGSAPREPGASMLVSALGERGTIGGGHLEFVATRIARDMLQSTAGAARLDRFSLGASLGQCCGGIVELWFQRYDGRDLAFVEAALEAREKGTATVIAGSRLITRAAAMRDGAGGLEAHDAVLLPGPVLYESIALRETALWLFGAGHVAKHLVNVIAPLPFAIRWVDSRENMFPAGLPANIEALHAPQPADEVAQMRDGDWALVMTHSHDEDFEICRALLEHRRFGWAGVIGSAPKAARFRKKLAQRGFPATDVARLAMPIGIGAIRSKEPAAIAVAVAAQLLQLRETRALQAEPAVRES